MSSTDRLPFANPAARRTLFPPWLWRLIRLAGLAVTAGLLWLLAARPELGARLFWLAAIPALPLLFLLAPGFWRNVCPMAVLNQLPRRLGLSAGRPLPAWARENAYLVAVALLVALVFLRHPLLNHHAPALLAMMGTALALALLGGFVLEGKSGWCGTFCPMAPLERAYGQSPLLLVPNRFCPTCHQCQKNCHDINPNATIFRDLADPSPRYVGHRKLFHGLLPGFIAWFFTAGDPALIGYPAYLSHLALAVGLSLALFFALARAFAGRLFRVFQLFTFSALAIFYGFGVPAVAAGLGGLLGLEVPAWVVLAAQGAILLLIVLTWARGLTHERAYRARVPVFERSSGRTFAVAGGQPLLEAIEGARIPVCHDCRKGECGSDPVVVVAGEEHLEPPSPRETATLRAMGLEGRARLACMCSVTGPVTIDVRAGRRARAAALKELADKPAPRPARGAGKALAAQPVAKPSE